MSAPGVWGHGEHGVGCMDMWAVGMSQGRRQGEKLEVEGAGRDGRGTLRHRLREGENNGTQGLTAFLGGGEIKKQEK